MSSELFAKKLEQAEARLRNIRQVLREKRRAREQLIGRVADDPELAGAVAELAGEIAVLREVEPALVSARDEATRNLSRRQRLEAKQKAKEKQPV